MLKSRVYVRNPKIGIGVPFFLLVANYTFLIWKPFKAQFDAKTLTWIVIPNSQKKLITAKIARGKSVRREITYPDC